MFTEFRVKRDCFGNVPLGCLVANPLSHDYYTMLILDAYYYYETEEDLGVTLVRRDIATVFLVEDFESLFFALHLFYLTFRVGRLDGCSTETGGVTFKSADEKVSVFWNAF